MPATEQTWRNQKTLHVAFGASAVVMAIATIWMAAADHNRQWKGIQLDSRKRDAWMTQSRHDSLAEQYSRRMSTVQDEIRQYDSQAIPDELLEEFKQTVRERQARDAEPEPAADLIDKAAQAASPQITLVAAEVPAPADDGQFADLDEAATELETAAGEVAKIQAEVEKLEAEVAAAAKPAEPAADAPAEGAAPAPAAVEAREARQESLDDARERLREAQDDAIAARKDVYKEFNKFIREAKRIETSLVSRKKALNGDRTAAVSELGIKIGQHAEPAAIDAVQDRINNLDSQLAELTTDIATAKSFRMSLESVVAKADADKALVAKELDTMKTDLKLLDDQVYQNTSNVGEWITRWPVLNALYSGNIRIEQNWLPGMTINYNFSQVARFDRCITCHRSIAKTAPRTATDPLYPNVPRDQQDLTVQLDTPAEQPAQVSDDDVERAQLLLELYGLALTDASDISDENVAIHYVLPESPAARAGLKAGDIVEAIDGADPATPEAATDRLLTLVTWGSPVDVSVHRGFEQPFTSHPRLDLYLSDSSPHPIKDVGCTICHDGQGSGTSFTWTSHTPDNADQQNKWAAEYGWFDNHHWIFPMKPARFVESNCLKCHHEKAGLEPSERFPEPPAPKLVEGWSLVEEYGCFGCHEINGYDSPEVTVGPDVRLEPNYYEAAAQLLRQESLTDQQRELAQTVINHPEDAAVRTQLVASLAAPADEASGDQPKVDDQVAADIQKLSNLLKEAEMPGEYRKVGPSLRHINSKVDYDWLYSWIRKPSDFRPSTKMPQFFGLHEHLTEKEDKAELDESERFEPIEIRALTEYLLKASDDFEYLEPAEGITEEASAERGKIQFETRGCLACHSHEEFKGIASTQGPDLSRMGAKLEGDKGRQWLYSWVQQPHRYHTRTKMPELFLNPIAETDALGKPTGKVTDPAADLTAFLLGVETDWMPQDVPARGELSTEEKSALSDLAVQWLASDTIPRSRAEQYLQGTGFAENQRSKLKADERLLIELNGENRVERQLEFVARRTIGKYGCFGCHDVPGFEDAKPIGTALVDWGRKETSKLAFENIHKFIETHGIDPENPPAEVHASGESASAGGEPAHDAATANAHAATEAHPEGQPGLRDEDPAAHAPGGHGHLDPASFEDKDSYFVQSLSSHGRDGFIWQKLRYPRSFDYKTTHNKGYNERLRMPKFTFNDQQREAVMTFVLGLVKEPPASKYLYKPDARQQAIADGRQVLDRFNCAGCHTLGMEHWKFAFNADTFEPPSEVVDYPFLAPRFSEKEIAESKAKDYSGRLHAAVHGQPVVDDVTGEPTWVDIDRQPISKEELLEAEAEDGETIPVFYRFTLWRNALLNGEARLRGIDEPLIPADREKGGPAHGEAYPAWGGDLARYLFPKVVERAKQANPQLNAREVWSWLPPPLMDEGQKVQTDWLHAFLMDPTVIRPAAVMRMPNFHMSSDEAAKLVNFFAASSGASFPYEYKQQQRASYLTSLQQQRENPLGEAMQIVTNGNYCVKCHAVADFQPEGDPNTFGPNLADVYRRLRPEFTRDWVANPIRILPYTAMPVNIPYRAGEAHDGGVSQDLYHGTSTEQLQGLVDLLMNFDAYARGNTSVTPLVQEAAEAARQQAAAAGEPPADGAPTGEPAPEPAADETGDADADESPEGSNESAQ